MTADDFEGRWRAAAHRDPMHATYPEAVPGYRAQRAAQRRTRPAEGSRKRQADLDAHRPSQAVEPITRTDHDTGGMIVHWPALDARPAEPQPAVGAPVTVEKIRAEIRAENAALDAAEAQLVDDMRRVVAELGQAIRDTADRPTLATIARADQPRRPWWVRIIDRADEALCRVRRWWR